jgi:hypothetical protein
MPGKISKGLEWCKVYTFMVSQFDAEFTSTWLDILAYSDIRNC